MERTCPRCGRDYTDDPYWTTSLRRHLARKNPCDRDLTTTKYVRETSVIDESVVPLDEVTWDGVIPKKKNRDVVPSLFASVFSDPSKVCFVQPNKSKNQIWVKVTRGEPVQRVSLVEFIRLFVNHVFIKMMYDTVCATNLLFQNWLSDNMIRGEPWSGECPDGQWVTNRYGVRMKNKPEFMTHMKLAVRDFLDAQTSKTHLKHVLEIPSL